jgi:hypothetical protein
MTTSTKLISRSGIDLLLETSIPDAAVDAEARRYAPSCFPGTREQYIDDITHWATTENSDDASLLHWMSGPAGVGKSALAQTCAENVKHAGLLGAAFFFSINGHDDHTRFFTTLAYQLSTVLPDYRELLNRTILNDKTLVKKRMTSQFTALVVEPLQDLERCGKGVGRRAIFIDGLDECQSKEAQTEIIELISVSVRAKSTPFCWAIFSRAEPHIVSAFTKVSAHCYSMFLPISRDADGEIKLYLHGGFENILRRRNLALPSSWPTDEDIQTLVNASAGLYAYAAAVLRFVDRYSYAGFKETLQAVINVILKCSPKLSISPFAELDAFYIHIMKCIPQDILPSTQLLLASMVEREVGPSWQVAAVCNQLGLSETEFRSICHQLQAVVTFRESPGLPALDADIDLARSHFDQELVLLPNSPLGDSLYCVHGVVNCYHKSFFDFLVDPTRSSTFCVTTPTVREELFNRYIQRYHHFAQNYVIRESSSVIPLVASPALPRNFARARGAASASVSLSWPQGCEFVDSILQLLAFRDISQRITHNGTILVQFIGNVSSKSLRKLEQLDYHMCLVADMWLHGPGLRTNVEVFGVQTGLARIIPGTHFTCLHGEDYKAFDPAVFLGVLQHTKNTLINISQRHFRWSRNSKI